MNTRQIALHPRMPLHKRLLIACIAFGCSVSGCSTINAPFEPLLNRIKNRGPLALSSENPYLVANMFMTRLAESSPEVQGFLKTQGTPSAVEVESSFFKSPTVRLYYPPRLEFYSLDYVENVWAITGPFTIRAEHQKALSVVETSANLPRLAATTPPVVSNTPPRVPPQPSFQSPAVTPAPATTNLKESLPQVTYDSRIKEIIKNSPAHPAELTPRGDLVHYVTYPGETLSMIARWYTFDHLNAGRIARINSIGKPNSLAIGETIVIPSYMLQNKNRLSEAAVRELKRLAEKS